MKIDVRNIPSSYDGFNYLASLDHRLRDLNGEEIVLDFENTRWISGNMCATFGAILCRIENKSNRIRMENISGKTFDLLSKNGFLTQYGSEPRKDTFRSTITYQRFGTPEVQKFAIYVEKHIKGKGIPEMSNALSKEFRRGICEIFENSVFHAESKLGVFSCGQYFPKREKMDFCVTDLGMGIPENVRRFKKMNLDDSRAIDWAMSGRSTTKSSSVPGGLGLKLLREFIEKNAGRILVASGRGYWELSGSNVVTKRLNAPFHGTAVNIEINTADTKSYFLTSEL